MERNTLILNPGTWKSIAIWAVLFLINWSPALGQTIDVNFFPSGGLTFRTGPLDFQNNYKGSSNLSRPYPSSRNVMGFSLSPGFGLEVGRFGLEYFSGLRYDVVESIQGNNDNQYNREFILDHHLNVSYGFKNLSYGLGASIVNTGKSIVYYENVNNPILTHESLEFRTINVFVSFPVWKVLRLETKIILMPQGYPYNRNNDYFMLSARLFYKFKFLNKKKEGVSLN